MKPFSMESGRMNKKKTKEKATKLMFHTIILTLNIVASEN